MCFSYANIQLFDLINKNIFFYSCFASNKQIKIKKERRVVNLPIIIGTIYVFLFKKL